MGAHSSQRGSSVTDSVTALAARCAVALYRGEDFLGSGLLAAPGQVLTCAHVVEEPEECCRIVGEPEECRPRQITVRWAGGELAERPDCQRSLIPPHRGSGSIYAPPDLALITVDAPPDQPYVWLTDQTPAAASPVVCLGYSEHTPEEGIQPDSALLQVAAASGGELIKVQQGEIPRGMSGSLVLDLDTQRVCGIVKASMDTQAPRGGWIIPVSVIARNLRETVELNMAGHGPNSPWRQAATRHAEFARQLFGSQSPLRVPDPPRDAPPSWWLDPRHQVARFQERPELEDLLAWATDEDPATPVAKLIIGEGGSGKTRLAVELATRLGACGWIAGLLTADDISRLPDIAKALPGILTYQHRVFIAIDYPEGLGAGLTEFLGQIPGPEHGIVRVLLLARFGGRWWNSIHPSGENNYLIDRDPIQLGPLGSNPDLAADRFSEAAQDYRLRVLGPGISPALADAMPGRLTEAARQHATAIELHALALVAVLHERDHGVLPAEQITWTDPLAMLVSHERKHWQKAALGRLSRVYGEELDGRILLAPTLLPVYRAADAAAAISRIPGLTDHFPGEPPDIAALLRDLYPPDGTSALRWWSPLPLDRLGETLLAEVLTDAPDGQSAHDYVVALLEAADLAQAVPGLTVMARLNADPQTSGIVAARIIQGLGGLATADGCRLLPALLLADRQVDPGRRSSERHLANLGIGDTFSLVQNLVRAPSHRLLQETGLVLLDHLDQILDGDEMRSANLPQEFREFVLMMQARGKKVPVGTLAHVHAKAMRAELFLRLGRNGDAVGPAQSAARSMRAFFRASTAQGGGPRLASGDKVLVHAAGPSDQSESFLYVLDVYARALQAVGRFSESADQRMECAAVARQMAGSADPQARRTAGLHLYQFAEILLELGRADQAELSARDAVQVARALGDTPRTAEAMTLWARTLEQAGRLDEARAVAADAVHLHREVASEIGSRAHLALARQALQHLVPQSDGQPDPLTELREEALRDPVFATPLFANAAAQRAQQLAEHGQVEEARVHMAEAVAQVRRLAADDPDTYLEFLAVELVLSAHLGLSADPASAAAEGVEIFRRVVNERDLSDLRMGLAISLQEHSLLLRGQGRHQDALQGFAEAIGLLRPLLAHDRWQTAVHLSVILGLFSETARKHGDIEQAVAAAREAIDLEVARTDDHTPAPADRLLVLRHMLFAALTLLMGSRVEQGAEPTVVMAITTEICTLARSFPVGTMGVHDVTIFATALNVIAALLGDAERPEETLTPLGEAIEVLREHAGSDTAGENTALLLQTDVTYVSVCRALGRHAEAARAMAEVLADCRRPLQEENGELLRCIQLAVRLADDLPKPAFTAEALQIVIELSRTSRELPAELAESQAAAATAAVLICKYLKQAASGGLLEDGQKAAALEISANVQFLAEHAPRLLGIEHAEVLTVGASILLAADDPDDALELNTCAIKLRQDLAATRDGPQEPDVGSLVLQGLILSGLQRHEDAVQPLEQALPLLLAAGQGITADQARLLNMTLGFLRDAYLVLGRPAATEGMMETVRAADLPETIQERRPDHMPASDLQAALQAAVEEADTERGVAALQQVLDTAVGRNDHLTAWVASRYLTTRLRGAGRLPEALRAADLRIAYGHQADIGPWGEIADRAERLQIRAEAGFDDQSILAEATGLIAQAKGIARESAGRAGVNPDWVCESLLRSSATAAGRLQRWPEMLRFVQQEAASLRDRGAPPAEVANAEFNAFTALAETGLIQQATELLDRCETAFRHGNGSQHLLDLGLVGQARAALAARSGDAASAVRLQSEALGRLYRSGDIAQIQSAHSFFSRWLEEADRSPARALAHELAAAVLAELTGQPADIPTITQRMFGSAGEYPSTLAQICALVDETQGVRLEELLHRLTGNTAASPSEVLSHLIRQVRGGHRAAFDELAQHRMEWDPVFAGMVAARQGDAMAALLVRARLRIYATDRDWANFSRALEHMLYQRDELAAAMSLDPEDQVFLRRCRDALDDALHIPSELAQAIPIAGELSRFLHAVQNDEPSSVLARMLEKLGEQENWNELLTPLRRILAGDRDPEMTSGLTSANAVIVSQLLGHLAEP
jgi:tetratricopeptide (TPR) repeat protein